MSMISGLDTPLGRALGHTYQSCHPEDETGSNNPLVSAFPVVKGIHFSWAYVSTGHPMRWC